jgi:phage shock protein C
MTIADEIKRLHEMLQSGALTDAEFAQAKASLLAGMSNVHLDDSSYLSGKALGRFRRSNSDAWLGGICGGIAKYTDTEAWIWRLLFALLFFSGIGFVAYVLGWIFIPREDA